MSAGPTYRIRGWDASGFEVSQNSRTRGPLKWVALPTKHDGKGFRKLIGQKEGAAFFGCWCLLVQVAAKCPTRGVLADDDGPLSSSDLHLKTGAPEELMARAIKFLHTLGWLETVELEVTPPLALPRDCPADAPREPQFDTLQQNVAHEQQDVVLRNVTERDVTERDDTRASATRAVPLPASLEVSETFCASWSEWLEYRKDRRLSMRGLTVQKQLEMLDELGPSAACDSIQNSIRNGWSGLFPPKENGNGSNRKQSVAEHNDAAFREVLGDG